MLDAHAHARDPGHFALHALEDIHDLSIGAIADGMDADLESRLRRRRVCVYTSSGDVVSSPLVLGSSAYGSRSAAPRDPSAPSA